MQKQRSPYTGGGFNLQQLKATTFGKNETLNGIPFLMQLAHQVQVQKRPMVHQHLPSPPAHMQGSAGGHGAGHERGLRSGTPRSFLNNTNNNNNNNNHNHSHSINHNNINSNANYNGTYEGDMMPPLSLGLTNSNLPVADDCLHLGHMSNMNNMNNMDNMDNINHMSNMDHMSNMGNMDHMSNMGNMGNMDHMSNMGNMDHMSNMGNMDHMSNMGNMDHMSNMGNMDHMSNMDHMGHMGHMDHLSNMSNMSNISNISNMVQSEHLGHLTQPEPLALPLSVQYNKAYQSDTDSETEYCQHMQDFDAGIGKNSRWRRCFDYLKSGMPPQRQERMEAALQRCCENTFFNHVLLVLQLVSILIGGTTMQSLHFCMNLTQVSFRLWRCKFQLRSLMRLMLWRMANAKGNDALLFLGVMLLSPWLFLISLIGFVISFMFQFKDGLGATLHQLRLQMLN